MPSHSTRATVPGCPLDRLDGAQVAAGGKTPPGGQKLNWLATCFGRGPATSYKARRFLENPSPAGLGLSGGFGWAAGALEVYCGQEDTQIGQRGPKIGQEGPQNWPRKAPKFAKKDPFGFVFWRNMPNMWVLAALGRCGWHSETFLLCMYYLCNCTMIRSSMMMIIQKLCCLCNPMIQQ